MSALTPQQAMASGNSSKIAYGIDGIGSVSLGDATEAWNAFGTSWNRFGLYHQICRDHYLRTGGTAPAPASGDDALSRTGRMAWEDLVPAADCATLTESFSRAVELAGESPRFEEHNSFPITWSPARAALVRGLLPRIFSPEVTASVEGYYGCHFQVISMTLSRAFPGQKEASVSFRWHRDHVPPQQLHLLVYLTGATAETGRTEALDFVATRRAAELGYSYPHVPSRTNHLSDIFGDEMNQVDVMEPELAPGGGMFLAAPRVLHRGYLPTKDWRDTLQIIMIPSPVPFNVRAGAMFQGLLRHQAHVTTAEFSPFGAFPVIDKKTHGITPDWAVRSESFWDQEFALEHRVP